ncbi:MAG: Flp family type IVb pilin [Litorimonas sp.]
MTLMAAFLNDESGATAIEYGLIAALIAVALISGMSAVGGSITDLFTGTESEIEKVFLN